MEAEIIPAALSIEEQALLERKFGPTIAHNAYEQGILRLRAIFTCIFGILLHLKRLAIDL
jgi:hypothetical protein